MTVLFRHLKSLNCVVLSCCSIDWRCSDFATLPGVLVVLLQILNLDQIDEASSEVEFAALQYIVPPVGLPSLEYLPE